ncbi:MAG: hypothetical protein EOS22_04740 [Mesorhizobium sp.]|uniref:hypothetical protein n=1 Tax=Mesorhizobium sp. TaxID=1871066 RepID=UPI000FEA02B7|nr:hypothetical protein [Mesorhizobium sp.]RWD31332.1 MAG: hypothetical protein EOS22_04740 [Mesorhizobium sp.]TJW70754.1 MAG: hypothetical protein E5V29_03325 [Mesorhizobium sp.]
MRLRFLVTCLAAMITSAQVRAAEVETVLWKNVGNWSVYVDRPLEFQCFVTTLYEDYTIFRFGFLQPGSSTALYLAIGNLNWTSIEEGKDYDLILQIDNEAGWRSPAKGMRFGTLTALAIGTNEPGFVEQLMRKHSLRVFFNGRQVLNLSLRGSNAALRELGTCQNAVDAYLGANRNSQPKDPFTGVADPAPKKDPFDL